MNYYFLASVKITNGWFRQLLSDWLGGSVSWLICRLPRTKNTLFLILFVSFSSQSKITWEAFELVCKKS